MKPKRPKSPPKPRNLAAKALRDPLFRPKVHASPAVRKRESKLNKNLVDSAKDEEDS